MFEYFDLDEAAAMITDATGKSMSVDDVLDLAFNRLLKVCSVIPGWESPGVGDLVLYVPSGDSGARDCARMTSVTDGFYQGLTQRDFQTLQAHGRLYLDGRPGELPNEGGEPIRVILGPESPVITVSDLRVSERELHRFIASAPSAEATEFSRAFDLYVDLDKAKETTARLRDAAGRTTGLEREANIRVVAQLEDEIALIHAELDALKLAGQARQRRQQDTDVLEAMRALGYALDRLPRSPVGKPGPKAEVRAKLPEMKKADFDRAWNRLRRRLRHSLSR